MKSTVLFLSVVFVLFFFASCDPKSSSKNDVEIDEDNAVNDVSDEAVDDDLSDEVLTESDETVDETADEQSDETIDEVADETSDETVDEQSDEINDETPDDFIPYTEYDFSDLFYVSEMSSVKECCFDLDGDSTIDNQLASIMTAMEQLAEVTYSEMIQTLINDGKICSLYEPLGGTMPFFDCFDEDLDYSDNLSGDESFLVWVENYLKYGSEYSAYPEDVYIIETSDKIRGTADKITDFPFVIFPQEPARMNITNAVIEIDLNGSSVPTGGVIGGVILMEDLAKGLNESLSYCTCLTAPAGLFYVESNKKLKCSLESNNCDSEDEVEAQCYNTGQFCNTYSALFTPDIDTDGDSVKDAVSAGYQFVLVTAGSAQIEASTD